MNSALDAENDTSLSELARDGANGEGVEKAVVHSMLRAVPQYYQKTVKHHQRTEMDFVPTT